MSHDPTWAGSSIVRNTSGIDGMYFAFIGRHGSTLDDGEDALIPGNILTYWQDRPQMMSALNYALQHNLVEVIKTPAVMSMDTSSNIVHALAFTGNSPVAVNPDYGSYSGDPTTL